ncbi:MAG: dTMP kinase [Candidatus Krumholzibacteriota bacterium]|nr:dTMP kinase [Candidatus Krumholzibacteriota bacterium]
MPGHFITFEGIEGSGKSTVAGEMYSRLREAGIAALLTREPGGTPVSEDIRSILLDPARSELSAAAELLLYLASRAQLVSEVIGPALEAGRVVLCDRFFDATVAYQGWARGLGEELVRDLNSFAVAGTLPELTFLFDLTVEEGFSRGPEERESSGIRKLDRLEREGREFHRKVREGYLRIARRETGRVVVIDASLSLDRVLAEVWGNIRNRLGLNV